MSTTAPPASALPQAPWKSLFNQHLSSMKPPQFVLSTLSTAPAGSSTPYVPRARYCIFRGFFTELPDNEHNPAERNPRAYESDLPTFTTDARMEKVAQIFGTGPGHAESEEQMRGSGGGGPVEAVWWCEEKGTQWRVRGRAFVVAEDVEGEGEESSGVRTVKSEVGKRMRVVDEEGVEGWSWGRELTANFGNQSPGIKGSFKGPPPGHPVTSSYDTQNLSLGAKVTDLHDTTARKNFRLVVIVPDVVEQTDISDPATARRFRYTFDESTRANAGWRTEELWP
ncbi:hypothetical protein BU24DRAFT_343000 [Aaosphaeria arxii CBS 175.79]|uniref:Pyridoxamine 5'-phosphate oxidase Alr4036 family FMN-binding domain-containing protein n=1 Tax=Aaosphaeria arxii CBS 175.79 TaxID=1450172 RepID=A0A6A5Y4Y8_9PLEO|nr:uncharacterized protein BU24DRAFT_343000 [Aaosphaeria arxii CBS 175.79]KAF2019911.1 hypothetical protein BU24DRAFT_343000 [Aaosphaeria arxii CBS 175.79]